MFGWEFPPHFTDELGLACYDLTKSLTSYNDSEILFVVPKVYGDEDDKAVQLIDAGDIFVKEKVKRTTEISETNNYKRFRFTGKYGATLMEEVANYAVVASSVANQYHFDLIHVHDWLTYPAGIAAKKSIAKTFGCTCLCYRV